MLTNTPEYLSVIENIKQEIKVAQYRATIHANSDLLLLYYDIGAVINEYKMWGNKFIDNLSYDIQIAFPERKGFSVRNLKYMAKFAARFSERKIVQEVLAQITWYHNIALMDKVKTAEEHIWYEDPYVFDFIPFREDMLERDIEQALVRDVTQLLLELGTGFAFLERGKRLLKRTTKDALDDAIIAFYKAEAGIRNVIVSDHAMETVVRIRKTNPFGEYLYMEQALVNY